MATTRLVIEVDDKDVKGAERSLSRLKGAAKDAGSGKKDIDELSGALSSMRGGAAGAASGLRALAAAAGPVGIAIAATAAGIVAAGVAAVRAGQQIFELSKEYADLGVEIGKLTEATTISAEALSALKAQAELSGREFSDITSGIDAFTKKLADAAGGSKEAREQLDRLGIDGPNAVLNVEGALQRAIETLAEMPKGIERARTASELFGSSGEKLLPFLDEFDGDLEKIIARADEFGLVIGEENVRQSIEFQRAITENQKHLEGLKNEFTKGFLPAITEVFESFNSLLSENSETLKSWARTSADALKTFVRNISYLPQLTLDIAGVITNPSSSVALGRLLSGLDQEMQRREFLDQPNLGIAGDFSGLERGYTPDKERRARATREPKLTPLQRVWTAEDLSQFARERGFEITSTTGGRHNVGSLHPLGRAIDIRTRDKTAQQIGELIAQALAAGIRVVDERLRPPGQRVWGGPHLHFEENDTRASFFNRTLGFGARSIEDLLALDEARRMDATQFIDDPRGRAEALRVARIQGVRDILDRAQGMPGEISTDAAPAGAITPRTTLDSVEIDRIARLAPGVFNRIYDEEERRSIGAGLFGEQGELEATEATFKRILALEEEYLEAVMGTEEVQLRQLELSFARNNHQKIVNALIKEAKTAQEEELDILGKQFEIHKALSTDSQFRQYAAEVQVLREKLALEQEIFDLEILITTQGETAAERYRRAWLEAIYEIRDENIRAVESQIRSQVRLADRSKVHNEQIRAAVLEHLSAQRSMTETIGGEIIALYEEIAQRSEEILDKSIGKIPILGGIAKTLARQALSDFTIGVLDKFFPGASTKLADLENPELGELKRQTSLLKEISLNTAFAAGAAGTGNVTVNAGIGGFFSALSGGHVGGGQETFHAGPGGFTGGDIGSFIRGIIDKATKEPLAVATAPDGVGHSSAIGRDGSVIPGGKAGFPKLAGNVGGILSIAGGLIPGNVGGIISAVGSGIGIASSLGSILGISALGGPIGIAVGAGIGLVTALLGGLFGSKKRKRDKNEKLPQLAKGFSDAIQEFRDLITQVRTFSVDPDEAMSRGRELRQQIASGFGIQFESKKYRRIARDRINQQLAQIDAQPDGLMQQLVDAVTIAKAAGERRQRILPEFAGGVFMDNLFRSQFSDFKRRNGLLPGSWSGRDYLPALLADAEMVLNPSQQKNVIANAGGRDVFAGAGIPNYDSKAYTTPPAQRMATGGFVRQGQTDAAPLVVQPNFSFELVGVSFEKNAEIWLTSDDGRRVLVKVIKEEM